MEALILERGNCEREHCEKNKRAFHMWDALPKGGSQFFASQNAIRPEGLESLVIKCT